MIKNYCFCLLFILGLTSCKSSKSVTPQKEQITYAQFRAQQKTFSASNGDIKYIDKGSGEVILLLHGVPTSSWLYRNMIDELAATHRVIAPDMLGFGSSDSPKGYDIYTQEQHAKRLLELMNTLQIKTWTHVTHDVGGLWTWELVKKEPNRISKLVLLNTIIYNEGFDPPIRFKPGITAKTAMWSYRNGVTTGAMLKGLFKSGLTENNLSDIDIEGYKKPLLEGKTNGMYYFFTRTCYDLPNYKEQLKSLSIPVLVIWGKTDSFLKWEPQKEQVINDLNILPENIHLIDAKHFIQEEKPKLINELILNFK